MVISRRQFDARCAVRPQGRFGRAGETSPRTSKLDPGMNETTLTRGGTRKVGWSENGRLCGDSSTGLAWFGEGATYAAPVLCTGGKTRGSAP